MMPQRQLVTHKPREGIYGDCARTCIAALLDLPAADVPHFFEDGNAENSWRKLDGWLVKRGMASVMIPFAGDPELVRATMASLNKDVYYILGGRTKHGTSHFSVYCGEELVCDPADVGGITLPGDDGCVWVCTLVALCMKREAA